MTFYYTYKITHLPSQRFYIGRRIFSGQDISYDQYMGSGIKILKMLKIYPRSEFNKEITGIYPTSQLMIESETKQILENIEDPNCLNLCIGDAATIGIVMHSLESRTKTSRSVLGENNPMHGRSHADSTKEKMRDAKRGKIALYKDGQMFKCTRDRAPNFIADGWFPATCNFDKLGITLSFSDCEKAFKLWQKTKLRVAKSRLDR